MEASQIATHSGAAQAQSEPALTLSATNCAAGLICPSVSRSAAGTACSAIACAAGLMPCSVTWQHN